MRLKEWKDSTGKKVSTTSSQVSKTPSDSYKKRFEKLIKYHIDHASSELESVTKKDIKDDGFRLSEHYNTGSSEFDREIIVSYNIKNNTFTFSIRIDNILVENKTVDSYEKLVERLESYMWLPDGGTPEYKGLLTEWVDSKGKKVNLNSSSGSSQSASKGSTKTNKEKFKELTDYMKAHANSSVEKVEVVRLDDGGFTYKEHWLSNTGKKFVLTLLVGYSRFNSSWRYELYMDTSLIKELQGSGWGDLIEEVYKYFHAPKAGTKEYDSLVEWVDSNGKKVSHTSSKSSSTTGDYWKRFNKLLFYHVTHKSPAVDRVVRTKVNKDGFHYTEHIRAGTTGYEKDVVVNIDPATESWKFQIYVDGKPHTGGAGDGYLSLLKELRKHMNLPAEGTLDYDEILNESLSIAEDFKLYENLWD